MDPQQPITDEEVERVASFLHDSYGHWLQTPDAAEERERHIRQEYRPYTRLSEATASVRDMLEHMRAGTL